MQRHAMAYSGNGNRSPHPAVPLAAQSALQGFVGLAKCGWSAAQRAGSLGEVPGEPPAQLEEREAEMEGQGPTSTHTDTAARGSY